MLVVCESILDPFQFLSHPQVSIVSARLDWRFGLLSMQTVAAMSTNRVLEKMAIGAGVTNPSNPFAAPKAQLPTLYIPVGALFFQWWYLVRAGHYKVHIWLGCPQIMFFSAG